MEAGGVVQGVKPSKCEALSSNPNTAKIITIIMI
jgi:hypothetical protein